MKKLRDEALAFGDIILTTTNKPDSKAIRKITKSDISHAMVYVDPCSVVDATAEGVHARNTQRMFFPEDCAVHVLRPTPPLAQVEVNILCNYEVLEDLGGLTGKKPDEVYFKIFEDHRASILDGIRHAFDDEENWDNRGRLHVRGKDIRELME